MAKRSLKPRSH